MNQNLISTDLMKLITFFKDKRLRDECLKKGTKVSYKCDDLGMPFKQRFELFAAYIRRKL